MRMALWILLLSPLCFGQAGPVEVWAASALQKIRPMARVQASNLVWNRETKTVSIAGAKNEHIPFQVVVTTPPPPSRYHPAAAGFFAQASDLRSAAGRIPKSRIKLYLEAVVLCYGKSSPIGATGFWPDALAPLTDPFDMAAPFHHFVQNRVLWVDVVTAPDTPAGDYTGTIRVTQRGRRIDELSIKLHVYDFALPEKTHLITYIGVSSPRPSELGGRRLSPAGRKAFFRKYYAFLHAHRMEPWFNRLLQPAIEVRGGRVTVKFDAADYDLCLRRWKFQRAILEAAPRELTRHPAPARFSPAFDVRLESYLKQVADYFRKNGWRRKLVFNSPIDEPNTAQAYADTRKYATLVHQAAPGVPFLVTEAPVTDNPKWGVLTGYANDFAIHGNKLNSLAVQRAIPVEEAKGGEITWYISCDQKYPQPNYFIDAPAMDPVMVPWITWRYGLDGILYWDIKHWRETADPWLNPVTYLSGFFCSGGYVLNGEGSLIYPGDRVRRYTGQRNVDGPVSSIRFELLREGIEDYETLWLLKSLGEPAFADNAGKSLVVDVRAFSRNPAELVEWRARLAHRIERLAAGKK